MTKQEIIADESRFQRVCDAYVRRHIGPCVSNLMYDVGQNLEACARIFDFDYDEALGWFQIPDYESAVDYFIDDADLDDLETIADMVSSWSDIAEQYNLALRHEEDGEVFYQYDAERYDTEEECNQAIMERKVNEIRYKVRDLIPDQSYQEISEHFNLEPEYSEIYEHWCIDSSWFADQLKQYGQVVFEFGGLTIFGRYTTGQAISIDGFLTRMVRDLPEDHWVWREA